jgi:DNA polymerase III epsilon subunit-like protein
MGHTRLLVIDTETGGTDPLVHSLLAIGAVIWDEGRIVGREEFLIREPEICTDADALSINRLDLTAVRRDGLSPNEAVVRIERFVSTHFEEPEEVVLTGHNVSFDVGFLRRLYRLAGKPYWRRYSHRLFDTASVVRYLSIAGVIKIPNVSSDAAFTYFGILPETSKRHTALGDAVATAQLVSRVLGLARRFPEVTVHT